MVSFRLFAPLLALLIVVAIPASAQINKPASDRQMDVPAPYAATDNPDYKSLKETSFYLTMKDGVKIAVNLYLPKGLKDGEKIPSILYQTRYWRSIGFRWPFNGLMEMIPSTPNYNMQEFVRNGYALVTVDVRGTGASFGTKDLTLPSYNEVQDGAEIVDWIIKQPWSDGKVGATGISYIGITALYLQLNQHPAVKAIAPMYSVFDLYDDIALPGGILMEELLEEYGNFCSDLDKNDLSKGGFLGKLLVKGVEPVKGQKAAYKQAIAEHTCNYYQVDEKGSAEFIDDTQTPDGFYLKYILSPHQHIETFNQSNVPIYSYSGWWDVAFTNGAVKQYLNFTNPGNKLILGPWSHGGVINVSPNNPGLSEFNHVGEVIKFFDHYLKGLDNGLEKEAPVHYFTMGQNKWKSSDTWPPINAEGIPFYFSGNQSLSIAKPSEEGVDVYISDETAGTGTYSRWNLSREALPKQGYPDRKAEDEKRICYTTAPLVEDIEVTGHPVISFYITSSTPDAGVFAYLEDVDENGKVYRVTEGLLRAAHRKVLTEPAYYKDIEPYHSFKKEDAQKLSGTEPVEIVMDLYPTSYQFKKGHSIRLAICGNDADYFKQLTPDKTEWHIYRTAAYPSYISLPIIKDGQDKAQGR